jgi:uncharacterized protein (DUF58 family)
VPAWTRRALVIAGILALLFFAYLTAIKLAYLMLYFVLLLIAVSWLWTRLGASGLSIRRDAPRGAYEVGEDFVETLEIRNRAFIGLPWVELVDAARIPGYNAGRAVSVGPRRNRRWRSQGRFISRGRYRVGPTRLITGDPFGFFQRSMVVEPESSVTVYPRLVDVSKFLPGASHTVGETIALGRFIDAPPDAFGIREYDPSDGFNRIHWPSTARLGRPMTKNFEKYEGSDLIVVLDLGDRVHTGTAPASTLEYAVSLAASVAVAGLSRSQSVGLVCNDARRTSIAPVSGGVQLRRILDFLAGAEADGSTTLATLLQGLAASRGQQSLVVITPNASGDWVDGISRLGLGGSRRSTVLHLQPETFEGRPLAPIQPGRALSEHLTWWSLAAGDEIFRRRGASRPTGREPLAIAT